MAVVLRPYRETDREHFIELFGDAEVSGFVGGPKSRADANVLFDALVHADHPRALAAFAADVSARMFGHAILFNHPDPRSVELGYMIERCSWGRGLGTAVATALLDQARCRGFGVAFGSVDTGNVASRRILEKLGGTGRIANDDDGDYYEYRILL